VYIAVYIVNIGSKKMIDFEKIPAWWPICSNSECQHAEKCLRHIAFTQVPPTVKHWSCVLPTAMKDGECEYFQKGEKVQMARGFKELFANIKNKYARHELRMQLTDYFGSKGSYYRYRDGERWLNPKLQQMIADRMKQLGIEEAPVFDEYYELYDFTNVPL